MLWGNKCNITNCNSFLNTTFIFQKTLSRNFKLKRTKIFPGLNLPKTMKTWKKKTIQQTKFQNARRPVNPKKSEKKMTNNFKKEQFSKGEE